MVGKPSNGVSVCVVKFPLLTFRVCNELSYIVPAAPAFCAQPKLCPPDVLKKNICHGKRGVRNYITYRDASKLRKHISEYYTLRMDNKTVLVTSLLLFGRQKVALVSIPNRNRLKTIPSNPNKA